MSSFGGRSQPVCVAEAVCCQICVAETVKLCVWPKPSSVKKLSSCVMYKPSSVSLSSCVRRETQRVPAILTPPRPRVTSRIRGLGAISGGGGEPPF